MNNNNNNDKEYNLMGITVGGFQVFDAPTFIPLRGLTFLFGPNSAGKSAVEDAIQIIIELFHLSSKHSYPKSWTASVDCERLERHWRRLNEDKELESYAPTMTLGATFSLITDLTSALVHSVNRSLLEDKWSIEGEKLNWPLKIDFLATFSRTNDPYTDTDFSATHDFTILIGQTPILVFEGEQFKLNFGHPVLAAFELENNFAVIALKYPEVIDYKDGWVKTVCFHAGNGMQAVLDIAGMEKSKSLNLDAYIAYCESIYKSPIPTDLKNALTEIKIFADELHGMIIGNLQFSSPSIVKASRTIPTTDDLTFFHGSYAPATMLKKFPIINTGDDQYSKLTGGLRETVNHMFSGPLFIDRYYQLDCDHRVIISPDAYHDLSDAIEYGEHIYHLQLVDAQKRTFEFEEVGSGLGYVLPILCSACDRDIEISILQQPELHLHPALQSALGDVFIECLSADTTQDCSSRKSFFGKQFVIETHSEHLLLRVLKRIRQTNSDRPPAAELQIKASDVSVLYFNPSLDGTTKVKHLRISDDGEFIDRWPRGFFTEREQDLFDE